MRHRSLEQVGAQAMRTRARMRAFIVFVAMSIAALTSVSADSPSTSSPALLAKLEWRNVGPAIGGRVVAVAGVPNNQNLFYMGGVDGGIWKSTDYGLVWTNITDGKLEAANNSIGAIAVAPSNANVLYIGTGESDIRGDVITGDGVYKSADAGKTWSYAGLRDTHTISAIVVDPRDSNVVYASSIGHVFKPNADRGVFKSTDGGKTWRKVLFVDDNTGAIDLVMDPKHPSVLYATMWQAYRTPWKLEDGGPGSGIYKSTDGGEHWANLTHNPGLPQETLGRMGITVAGSDPNVVYTIIQAKHGGIFRSNDAGATWKRVNDDMELRQRAFYYMRIYADPAKADTIYVPQVGGLWVSRNGGKTFTALHTPHGDNHIVWINPRNPRILLEGNDGGATVSTDGGETWSNEHNQLTGQFYHIALDDQFPFHIYGAQQDEGSFEGPSASPTGSIGVDLWRNVAYGESTFVAPQPGDPNVTYGSGYFSIFLRYDMSAAQYSSVSPWPEYLEGSSSAEQKYRFGWTHPILFAPTDPNELLIGSQYVMRSDDHGQSWKEISPDLTRNDRSTEAPSGGPIDLDQSSAEIFPDIEALGPSPIDGKIIWAGSQDGLVHVTTDGGAHWQSVTPPELPQWCEITSIEPSHVAGGTAYLTASRYMWDDFHPYVFQTTDYGKHWTRITSGLPDDEYVFAIRQDPADSQLLFLGTKHTVYVSFDGGGAWQPLTLNLPHVQVRDIAIDTRQGSVAVATHGRSFWVLDNIAFLEQLTKQPPVNAASAYVFAPQGAWLTHAFASNPFARLLPAVGTNPPFGATVFFHIPSDYDGKTPVSLTFSDAQGHVIRNFTLHLRKKESKLPPSPLFNPGRRIAQAQERLTAIEPGMNRFQWDLRYPDATDVKGFEVPVAAGGLNDDVSGPLVTPGRYTVVLNYDGRTSSESFDVTLDPRLRPATGALADRLALGLRIHQALDSLDRSINEAIDARDALSDAIAAHRMNQAQAQSALASLDREIGNLVERNSTSSEGPLLYETKLRSHLAYLAAEIDLAYDKPTQAEYAVFDQLNGEAQAGEQHLQTAISEAKRL
jgi:photosystem II stability/assembly factor-like uncharacterized protein